MKESPAQIARLLANAEARAARLLSDRNWPELLTAIREIMLFDSMLRQLQALHAEHSDGTISDMQEQSLGVRIAAGRHKQSDSRKAQIAAGKTDQEVATFLKVPRNTVAKWHTGTTQIPEESADKLAAWGIPKSSWKRVRPA